MIDWFIYNEEAAPGPVQRWWARHLDDQRERALFEFYLASWGRGLAAPTLSEQIEAISHDIRFSFTAHSWQTRRQKFSRIALGARRVAAPANRHLKG